MMDVLFRAIGEEVYPGDDKPNSILAFFWPAKPPTYSP